MKCTGISVSDGNSQSEMTLFQFVGSKQEESPLGKLLVALVQETAWSGEYTINAQLAMGKLHLSIHHKTFLSGRPLEIGETGKKLSVSSVEEMVRSHIRESQEWTRPFLNTLQGHVNDLERTLGRIATDKAVAAIIAIFPKATIADLESIQGGPRDLYAFGKIDDQSIFVARKVGNDFVGGVARIHISYTNWYGMKNGVSKKQRHGRFWIALAHAFAVSKLHVLEENLYFKDISAREKPFEWPQDDSYVVDKVILGIAPQETEVIVEFGPNNLPKNAYVATTAHKRVAGLIDKHMTL